MLNNRVVKLLYKSKKIKSQIDRQKDVEIKTRARCLCILYISYHKPCSLFKDSEFSFKCLSLFTSDNSLHTRGPSPNVYRSESKILTTNTPIPRTMLYNIRSSGGSGIPFSCGAH